MTTDDASDYDMVQIKFRIPSLLDREIRMKLSHMYPVYHSGVLQAEMTYALKLWLQDAHAHQTTVLSEAENKPNWHTRKKPIKVPGSEAVPEVNPNPTAIVLNDNGKSSGGHWLFNLANGLGVVITDEHKEMARRIRSDPVFRKQKYEKYEMRVSGKLARSASKDLGNKVSERNNNNAQQIRQIKLYLNSKGQIDNQGRVAEKYFRNAISIVYKRSTEKRAIDRHIEELENDKEITRIGIDFSCGDGTIKGRGYRINSYEVLQ